MGPAGGITARFSAMVVDDDPGFRNSLGILVEREGFEVREAGSLADARKGLAKGHPDVVLVDLSLPDGDGLELLRDETISAKSEIIVVTGNATVDSAVQALREGALDYLSKPPDRARLKSILASVVRTREFKAEVQSLRGELRELGRFGRLVGRSPEMQGVYDLIARVAPTQASVLLAGESGTGKELAAETIHRLSRRRDKPFLAVNCGAVATTLIESELFGHEKGSFTGADTSRRGYFEEANGGTLLLDEVAEMPPELQTRLLRVLESGAILRVGGSDPMPVDVRVIAATNRDPAQAVREGALREDLYYRLNVFPIQLPPLRQRGADIELLADHFLEAVSILHIILPHESFIAGFRLRVMEYDHHMRLDRDASVIAASKGVLENVAHPTLPFSWPIIIGVIFGRVPGGILDVDVRDMIAHMFPKLPWVLLRPGFRFGTIGVENGIGGVKHPFETGTFVEQLEGVLPTHAAVIHAVFVNRLQARVEEHISNIFDAAENFSWDFMFVITWFETHDANVSRAQTLHAWDSALDFGERNFEWITDFLGPVHDRRAETINTDISRLQFPHGQIERLIGNIVEIRLGKAGDLHSARFEIFPAQFPGGLDLTVYRVGAFIADTCKNHMDFRYIIWSGLAKLATQAQPAIATIKYAIAHFTVAPLC